MQFVGGASPEESKAGAVDYDQDREGEAIMTNINNNQIKVIINQSEMAERKTDSLYQRFASMRLLSSNQSQSRLKSLAHSPQLDNYDQELTPVIEE